MYDEDDLFDESDLENTNVIDKVSNGEETETFVNRDGEIYCSDGVYICDEDDEEMQDKIDEYKEGWRETHWNKSDWADWYGCNEDDVDDCMDDDIKDYD